MCSVKFDEMFENNIHNSDADVRVCSVKLVEMLEKHTYLSDSDVQAYLSEWVWRVSMLCQVRHNVWVKYPFWEIMRCKNGMWSSSACFRIISIAANLINKWALCSYSKWLRSITIFEILTCERALWSLSTCLRIIHNEAILTCECALWSSHLNV